jgi:hypothetical protein
MSIASASRISQKSRSYVPTSPGSSHFLTEHKKVRDKTALTKASTGVAASPASLVPQLSLPIKIKAVDVKITQSIPIKIAKKAPVVKQTKSKAPLKESVVIKEYTQSTERTNGIVNRIQSLTQGLVEASAVLDTQ